MTPVSWSTAVHSNRFRYTMMWWQQFKSCCASKEEIASVCISCLEFFEVLLPEADGSIGAHLDTLLVAKAWSLLTTLFWSQQHLRCAQDSEFITSVPCTHKQANHCISVKDAEHFPTNICYLLACASDRIQASSTTKCLKHLEASWCPKVAIPFSPRICLCKLKPNLAMKPSNTTGTSGTRQRKCAVKKDGCGWNLWGAELQ